ncbi:MAG: hypothetical protein IJT59_00755 [Desulfovibrionaceae bacterium]|nr:hypothetical protein [Desulfovibrionaceae bacterium]
MSDSTWLIRPPSEQADQTAQKTRLAKSQSKADKFAALMAAQNANTTNTTQSSPGRNFVLAGRSPSDLLRMQNFNKAQNDIEQTRAISGLLSFNDRGSTLDLARSMGQARHIRAINGRGGMFNANLGGNNLGDFVHACPTRKKASGGKKKQKGQSLAGSGGIGVLSAQFESGKDGIAAVGYDGTGGTSYGKFQIASKVGTMTDFLKFLDNNAPDLAKRLRSAGPANTGSRHGAMPDMWRTIASEDPERFEELQETFAAESHYKPALNSIVQKTGLKEETLSDAMREVIWSTAIQHGPAGASKIFVRADGMSGSSDDPGYERKMINNVYQIRATQFGSSTEAVRAAVQNRFKKEKLLALDMLGKESQGSMA